jgi:hypothetical protein
VSDSGHSLFAIEHQTVVASAGSLARTPCASSYLTNTASNVSVTNLINAASPSCLIVDRIFANGFEGV